MASLGSLFIGYESKKLNLTLVTENLALASNLHTGDGKIKLNFCLSTVTFFRLNFYLMLLLKFHPEYKTKVHKIFNDR